ncbi:MAG: TetR/AcrR family transcriptional regulator [Pseudomonadota bacterium]|nr:TetR/AcrR family transcriptional regulator [Pseudomonadota bacterium]
MSNANKPKQRLTRQDWIDAAIELLTEAGICAVSIDRLATQLGVTRGSFYHHFADRGDLLQAVLAHWAQQWTYAIRKQIGALGLDPSTTLFALMNAIRNNQATDYDAPFRAWALHDPLAREVVRQVDEARLGYIRSQFEALGFSGEDLENRTRLYLYYEVTAPAMFASPSPEQQERLLLERHRFLTTARVD